MRPCGLHPTVWTVSRQANAADHAATMSGADLEIAKDQTVILCPYAVHHRAALWGRPGEFSGPNDSWSRPTSRSPISRSPRARATAWASVFAVFEALIIMAMTLQRYGVQVADPASVRPAPMITLRPDGPVNAHVTPRQVRQAA